MAVYASPFFQNILSLTEHCVPKPAITTYQDDYQHPMFQRNVRNLEQHVDPPTQKTLKALKLDRKDGKVAVNAQYCTPESLEAGKTYPDGSKKGRLCSKIITTYMVSYPNPHERLKRWELFESKKGEIDMEKLVEFIASGTDDAERPAKTKCFGISGSALKDQEPNPVPILKEETITPQWKIDGWKAKKSCWIRPLEERKEYAATLAYKNPPKKTKCVKGSLIHL